MRYSDHMFQNSYENKKNTISGVTVVAVILSILSVLAAVLIIINFEKITAGIAVWMAEFLTSGFLILIAVMIVIYLIVKLKWKIRRHLRGW